MFISKLIKVLTVTFALFLINFLILPSSQAKALQINNFNQNAPLIVNCYHQNTLSWGDSDCTSNLSSESPKENNISTSEQKDLNYSRDRQPIITVDNTTSNQGFDPNQLTNLLIGSCISVIGTSGVILLILERKKLNSTKQVQALKERVENLETIVTQDKY